MMMNAIYAMAAIGTIYLMDALYDASFKKDNTALIRFICWSMLAVIIKVIVRFIEWALTF